MHSVSDPDIQHSRSPPGHFFKINLPVLLYNIIMNLHNTTLKNTLHYYNLLTLLYRKICPVHVAIPITIEIMNLILLEIRYLHCNKLRTKHYLQ